MKIYRVGGYVRDQLLGLTPHDCDYVVVGATVDEMLARGFIPVGKAFPVFLHPTTKEEYALARTESKSGRGHTGFAIISDPSISLEQDLARRDLTINAMARAADGSLIDPFNGVNDLKHKLLRHVSAAFSDDPLRILRVARFAAKLDFEVAPETMALLTAMAATRAGSELSRERILSELDKALAGNYSFRFFEVLTQSHNLSLFFPALAQALSHESNWQTTRQELQLARNQDQRYMALAISLSALDNSEQAIGELSHSKLRLRFLKSSLQLWQLAQTAKANDEEWLASLYQLEVLRNYSHFQNVTNCFQEWLLTTTRQTPVQFNLNQFQQAASLIKQFKPQSVISAVQSPQQIANSIRQHHLALIQQARSSSNIS